MPIYEYECLSKGHRFEELQKVNSRSLTKCKICGGAVKKLISKAAFHLRGGGWFKDGYSNSDGGGEKKSEEKKESSPKKSEEKPKTESSNKEKV